MMVFGLIMQ